ncbi:MAG: hypothetical protein ACYCVD_00450 [Desulfitobacteriaceae bacterium]
MQRFEILTSQREKIMNKLTDNDGDRTKLLVALMDVDDEIEEIEKVEQIPVLLKSTFRSKWESRPNVNN